jgi:hypothetical protein
VLGSSARTRGLQSTWLLYYEPLLRSTGRLTFSAVCKCNVVRPNYPVLITLLCLLHPDLCAYMKSSIEVQDRTPHGRTSYLPSGVPPRPIAFALLQIAVHVLTCMQCTSYHSALHLLRPTCSQRNRSPTTARSMRFTVQRLIFRYSACHNDQDDWLANTLVPDYCSAGLM